MKVVNANNNGRSRRHVMWLALVIAVFLGCAQPGAYQAPVVRQAPVETKSHGLLTSGRYRGLAVADVDNDGALDVIGGSSWPGAVAVWYGDGRGGLPEPRLLPFKGDVRSVVVADIDGDGLKDIICSVQRESSGVMVWRNRPGFQWEPGNNPDETGKYEGVMVADVNKDGFNDVIAACTTSDDRGGIRVWIGDGKGNWIGETGPTSQGLFMGVALGDFDQDGNLDLVGAGWGTYGALRIWFGDGGGGWSAATIVAEGSYYGATVQDIDNDGHPDILAATYREGVRIFTGDGQGHFVETARPVASGSFWRVFAADLDQDGRSELLASSLDSKGIVAWKKAEKNGWELLEGRFPTKGTYYEIATGDLNRDGRDDICSAGFEEGIHIWLGKGGRQVAGARGSKDLFRHVAAAELADISENSVFTAGSGVPEYRVGINDLLAITLWKGNKADVQEVPVTSDGKITFGFVEDLYVLGLTTRQLDDLLSSKLSEYIKHPRIDVMVRKYQSKSVTLTGEIFSNPNYHSGPGRYFLSGKTTVLEAVTRAGGPTRQANLSRVSIRRKDGRALIIDLYKVFSEGDRTQNVVLDDGDLVVIPAISKEANRVYVYGEVKKPGLYTFSGSGMHVFDAISEAGGVTVFAKENSTKVVRGDISKPEVISADLKKLVEQGDVTQNVMLANGDLVYVPRSFIGDINRFVQQITPLMRLIIYPPQVVNEYDRAANWLND